tara:strand:+ start:1062 stop:1529 length:468 start_codon:yes stop_codon:yes gene_type:complete
MKKGKIYKLINETTKEQYIGSSQQKYLSNRLAQHKTDAKRNKNSTCSKWFIANNKISIHLIETIEFETIEELRMRERYHIENNDCVNINIPTRTKKEYRNTKECKLIEHLGHIKYRKNNLEKIHSKVKQKIKCSYCDKLITKYNMKRHINKLHSI